MSLPSATTNLALAAAFAVVWGPLWLGVGQHGPRQPMVHAPVEHDMADSLTQHCGNCHQGGKTKGDFDLDALLASPANASDWEKVRSQLRLQMMPPPRQETPVKLGSDERAALVGWLENTHLAPPTVPLRSSAAVERRLNRTEYNNTIQALLGLTTSPADRFPEDETAMGFDNIAAAQQLPPSLVESYLQAAQDSLALAFDPILPKTQRITLDPGQFPDGQFSNENGLILTRPNQHQIRITTDHGGEGLAAYELRLKAYARKAGDELPNLTLNEREFPLQGSRTAPDELSSVVLLEEGATQLSLGLANPYRNVNDPDPHNRFRQIVFQGAELVGPLRLKGKTTPQTNKWLTGIHLEEPAAAQLPQITSRVLEFAQEAVRRPLEADFSRKLSNLCAEGAKRGLTASEVTKMAMTATLVSPGFLFLHEPPTLPMPSKGVQLLDDEALAVRLAYFLWKAPPDENLRRKAANREIRTDLRGLVNTMLRDKRSVSLAKDFAGQWLQLRNISLAKPDGDLFPEASPNLLASFATEVELFVHDLINRRRPVREFLQSETTFANAAIAHHYGLSGRKLLVDEEMIPVSLKGTFRKGLLGKAGVLTLTSQPNRTSPVARGKWVLECLLGMSPPPPPPNVPTLTKQEGQLTVHGTQRQQLEAHRTQAGCINCHASLDPYGFALEKFDALGRWRFHDQDQALDVAAALPSGKHLRGAVELSDYLATEHLEDFRLHLATSLLAYASGQEVGSQDIRQVREVMRIAKNHGDHFGGYVLGVVRSRLFQTKIH